MHMYARFEGKQKQRWAKTMFDEDIRSIRLTPGGAMDVTNDPIFAKWLVSGIGDDDMLLQFL